MVRAYRVRERTCFQILDAEARKSPKEWSEETVRSA